MTSFGWKDILTSIRLARRGGHAGVVVTVVRSDIAPHVEVGTRIFMSEGEVPSGSLHPLLDDLVVSDSRESLSKGRSQVRSYRLTETDAYRAGVAGGNVDLFFDVFSPPPKLVVAGAGHIAVPLVRMAHLLDFETIVLDDRPDYASRERFPDANDILVGPYGESLARLRIDCHTYIVLVTRGHVHDRACLEAVIDSPAAYIGMIGSKRRVRTVMQSTLVSRRPPDSPRRIFAPIGLDIGSQTPAEIALAIMAEITNLRRGGRAPSLSRWEEARV